MSQEPPGGPPLRQAAVAQLLGALLAGTLVVLFFPAWATQPLILAGLQGLCAALVSHLRRGPLWWLPIHLGFMPLAVLALALGLPSWVWLAGFVLLLLVFGRTDRSRVPLYLTNAPASEALAGLLPAEPATMIDLGCGDGGLLRRLARARPDCRFVGFEHAPLTWAWAWLSCRKLPNVEIRLGDFWAHPLDRYTLVYAFLSPAPMQQLWDKARTEMKAGALLVSNSFPIPDVRPERSVEVADRRRTRFHCYRPAGPGHSSGYRPGPDGTGTYPWIPSRP
ncbi:MAG: hypothetical protein A3H93_02075 [Rhodocyclales bacterium RIFCSPLOWO2_02_FULL_63_24]|nr:MAG: hypothetical protein A2040_00015 [Rhodocyclales bacterium GWA2_65_19]OHC72598.1 MAG: hypothetical protein A3H93_02075 [Rhodocyclales bacterium RIFCSPLOWO2_02_FULL_63_24]